MAKSRQLSIIIFNNKFSDIDECEMDPCQNGGNCTDGINEYTCKCADGWEGDDCELGEYTTTDPTPPPPPHTHTHTCYDYTTSGRHDLRD